jgi:hypothetical protein
MDIYDYKQLFKEYSSNGEVVIPDTQEVKSRVTKMFKFVFGDNFDISESSPNGRIIETLTVMFTNILGVIAQNANGLNPNLATGNWLDTIGAIFGVGRNGDSDEMYRIRIRNSQSRGKGFVQSVWNAVSNVSGVTSVCVLENGFEDPYTFPETEFTIDPHSIFVCCKGGSDLDVAEAIYSSKSAGCGYHMSENQGTIVDQKIEDADRNFITTVRFYRPTIRNVRFSVSVRGDAYTGIDIVGDTQNIVSKFMSGRSINSKTTKADIISAIGISKLGIVCTNVIIEVETQPKTETRPAVFEKVDQLIVKPYQFISVTNNSVSVAI